MAELTEDEEQRAMDARDARIKELLDLVEELKPKRMLEIDRATQALDLKATIEGKDERIREMEAACDNLEGRLRQSAADLAETQDRYRLDIATPNRFGPALYHAVTVDSARWVREDGEENLLAIAIANYRIALEEGPTWSDPENVRIRELEDEVERLKEERGETDDYDQRLVDENAALRANLEKIAKLSPTRDTTGE